MMEDWDDDDDFLLNDEEEETQEGTAAQHGLDPWLMLIVDDKQGIHDVTQLALKDFSFDGRNLHFLSAFSAEEALEILATRNDIAVILLDVVMENDHAGLDCARKIRDDLENQTVRIVLRTGQPGQAPERDVILGFDINDYRNKTELNEKRLFTTIVSALRSYRDLVELEKYREDAYGMLAQNTFVLQQLIDQSPHLLCQLDRHFSVQRCNQHFAARFDKTPDEMIGVDISQKVSKDLILSLDAHRLSLKALEDPEGEILCYVGAE